MLDLAFLSIMPLLILYALKYPFIGIGLWYWISVFKINDYFHGAAGGIPFVALFAALAITSTFFAKNKEKLKSDAIVATVLMFFIWTTLSTLLAIPPDAMAWERWNYFFKIIVFFIFFIWVVSTRSQLEFVMIMLILGVGTLGVIEGLKFVSSGGGHRISGIKGSVGDNNFFALFLCTTIPLLIYFMKSQPNKKIVLLLGLAMLFIVLGIISTYSRGGFLGLAVISLFLIKDSKNKLSITLFLGVIIFAGYSILPEAWFSRMDTLENAEEDSSFMGRVVAWKISALIASDNLTGAGFNGLLNYDTWIKYALQIDKLSFIDTPPPDMLHVHAAHSSYFQVVGDQGWIGLMLFLLMLFVGYRKISSCISVAKNNGLSEDIINLCICLRMSLIVYCIVGAAISVAYSDVLYGTLAMIYLVTNRLVPKELDQKKSE